MTREYLDSPIDSLFPPLIHSGRRDIVDDGVQPEVGVLPDAPGLVPRRPARRHGPRRREGQQAAGLRPRPRRLDQGQDAGRGQQKKDRMKSHICRVDW